MTKKNKQEVLPGLPDPNGKVIGHTDVVVSVPEVIHDVEIRELEDGNLRIMNSDAMGTGENMEDAIKAFKKNWKLE
jgi:hypothetical protein